MNKLIICDTLYQIIVGLQLCNTVFAKDTVDFWISDHSIGSEGIAHRLAQESSVNHVEYIKTKSIVYAKKNAAKIKNLVTFGFGLKKVAPLKHYEEIVYYNNSLVIYGIVSYYERHKLPFALSRFEEGIFSYGSDSISGNSVKHIDKIRQLVGKSTVHSLVSTYYCFFPEIKGEASGVKICKIPSIEENYQTIRNQLIRIFHFDDRPINEKYIFFASSSDIDGRPYGETEAIIDIANLVGKDNIVVKIHPRDTRDVYTNNGIKILPVNGIPWEVYQICSNLSNKIMISATSGAFINGLALLRHNSNKCFFIYPCIKCTEKYFIEKTKELNLFISELENEHLIENVHIISNVKDLSGEM